MERSEFFYHLAKAKGLGYTIEGADSETTTIRIYRSPGQRYLGFLCPVTFVALIVLQKTYDLWEWDDAAHELRLAEAALIVTASDGHQGDSAPISITTTRKEIVKALLT